MNFPRAGFAILLALAWLSLALAPRAAASPLMDFDMASLADGAQAIVLVEEPEYKTKDWVMRGNGRVVESFKGAFKPGDLVPLAIPTVFNRRPDFWDENELPPGLVLMFLTPAKTQPEMAPFPSGIKYLTKQGVLGCQQLMQPGPYSPVPMKPELISLPTGTTYDREALIRDLHASIERAGQFRTALDTLDFVALSNFIRKPAEETYDHRDRLSLLAAQAFAEHAGFDRILDLLAAKYQKLGQYEFRDLTQPFRTQAGCEFLLQKSGTLPKGAAAATVHELLGDFRSDASLRDFLKPGSKPAKQPATH